MPKPRPIRTAPVFVLVVFALFPLAAQDAQQSKLSSLEAHLGGLAGVAHTKRIVSGSIFTAFGVLGGGTLLGLGLAGEFGPNESEAAGMGTGLIVAGALVGGLLLGIPDPAETYWRRFSELPEGFESEDAAKIAAGEAYLDSLADEARSSRMKGAILLFAGAAWGIAASGYLDPFDPGLAGRVSPYSSFAAGPEMALTQSISFLASGLVFAILPSAAEDARESYFERTKSTAAPFRPYFALGPGGPAAGVKVGL